MNDPIRHARHRTLLTWVTSTAVWLPLAYWAFRPLPDQPVRAPEVAPQPSVARVEPRLAVDPSAFAAQLWNPPPTTASAAAHEPPPPPPSPLRLQLIGIVAEPAREIGATAVLRAALYDPDTDRLYLVTAGESVGAHRVKEVSDQSVTVLAAGRQSPTRLVLKQPGNGGAP